MKKLLLGLLLSAQAFAVTANKVWRVPNGGTLPSWGAVNFSSTNAITGQMPAKTYLPTVGQQISAGAGGYTITNTMSDVTNLSVTITTSGRPVFVGISDGYLQINNNCNGTVLIRRDVTDIAAFAILNTTGGIYVIPGGFWYIDTPAAGTYTYKVRADDANSTSSSFTTLVKLVAFEM